MDTFKTERDGASFFTVGETTHGFRRRFGVEGKARPAAPKTPLASDEGEVELVAERFDHLDAALMRWFKSVLITCVPCSRSAVLQISPSSNPSRIASPSIS